MSRTENKQEKPVSAKLNRETHRKFKLICVAKGMRVHEQLELVMNKWIEKNKTTLKELAS